MRSTLRDWLAEGPFTLALASGFFGFFAHTGALAALDDEGLTPAACGGSSAGALVASLYASGLGLPAMTDALFRLERSHFWDPALGPGLLRGELFRALLGSLLPVASFAETRVPLAVSVFDLFAARTRVIREGPIEPAVRASCAVPGLFRPVRVAGRLCYDGGIADRAGVAGATGRVLVHYLLSTISRRDRPPRAPAGGRLVCLGRLPVVGPFRLHVGVRALDEARAKMRTALALPVDDQGRVLVLVWRAGRNAAKVFFRRTPVTRPMRPRFTTLVGATGASAALLGRPAAAQAEEGGAYAAVGFLYSRSSFDAGTNGFGAEVSYMHYDSSSNWLGFGAFGQAQSYDGPSAHGRFALGAQAGAIAGVELGGAFNTGTAAYAPTFSAHVAPYVSLGFLAVSLRIDPPFAFSGGPHYPTEFALSFAFKFPYPFGEPPPRINFGHGLPFRVQGARRECDVNAGVVAPESPGKGEGGDRAARLAALWLADARAEHASVAAFARLSLALLALGAPTTLVGRAHSAALDELRHADLCFRLASRYAGVALRPGAFDEATAPSAAPDLARLAVDSFLDGCVGEGTAALRANRAAAACRDPEARRALSTIARDEDRHARLAWSVVSFCLRGDRETVGPALAAAASDLVDRETVAETTPDDDLRAAGHLSYGQSVACYALVRSAALARLGRKLARTGHHAAEAFQV